MSMVHNEMEYTIDLVALAKTLWKNILAIALVAVLVGSAAFGFSAFVLKPEYKATASLYVNNSSFQLGSTSFSISNSDLTASTSLVSVYLYILESRTTMEEVISEAELSYTPTQLKAMISAKGVSSTGAFEVTVTSSNPAEVELIANTIAKILPDRIAEIVDGTSVRIVDYAIIPASRSGPSILKNTVIGILGGAILCMAVIVVFTLLNDHSRDMIGSADDLHEMYPDMMVLAMIPDMRQHGKRGYYASDYGYYSSYYGPTDSKKKEGKSSGKNR